MVRKKSARKVDDDRLYGFHQFLTGVWPPNATYICSRCGRLGPLVDFEMEREFGSPDLRQCKQCAKTPRPLPKPPTVSVKPKRPNRAAELAAARIRYEEEQARIRQTKEDDDHYDQFMKLLEEHPEAFGISREDDH
jgi:hypothetical protein